MNPEKNVVDACKRHWESHKSDCSGFVKAVAAELGVILTGDADSIVGAIEEGGSNWLSVRDGVEAKNKADAGYFVIGGLKGKDHAKACKHGHVVVVVPGNLAHGKYPTAYWGSLRDGKAKKNATMNWSWEKGDRDKVVYAAHTL